MQDERRFGVTHSRSTDLDDEVWRLLSRAATAVEDSWRSGREPNLADTVREAPDEVRTVFLTELIKVDQECAAEQGHWKDLEQYLLHWPELRADCDLLRGLVIAEYQLRSSRGETEADQSLKRRFPEVTTGFDWSTLESPTAAESPLLSEHLRPGSGFGRFEIRGQLGRGCMGTVYRAYDTLLEREVALKIPTRDLIANHELEERFVREGRAMARLQHPNLCPVLEAAAEEGVPYLCMRFIEGPNLAERIRRDGPLHPRHAADLAKKIARAVECLHREQLLHRDIKPDNILISIDGEPILTDFGLATACQPDLVQAPDSEGTPIGSEGFSGTPAFMAPERFDDARTPSDQRSDVYSLGVLLFYLLTGDVPFQGTIAEVRAAAQHAPRPSVRTSTRGVSRELDAVCSRAMAADREDRYPSAAALAEALDVYLNRPVSRFGPWDAAVAAIVMVGLLLLAVYWRSSQPPVAGFRSPPASSRQTPLASSPEAVPPEEMERWQTRLAELRSSVEAVVHRPADDPRLASLRVRLLTTLQERPPDELAVDFARLLARMKWPRLRDSDPDHQWWNQLDPTDPGPPIPDDGPREILLPSGGALVVQGITTREAEPNGFRLRLADPRPFRMHLFALQPGRYVFLRQHWDTATNNESDTLETNDWGYALLNVVDVDAAPHNWHSLRFERPADDSPATEFLVYIWQEPAGE